MNVNRRALSYPVRVAQDDPDDPGLFLVADQNDLDAGEINGPAYTETKDGSTRSAERPLQTFYKFGVWYSYTGEEA